MSAPDTVLSDRLKTLKIHPADLTAKLEEDLVSTAGDLIAREAQRIVTELLASDRGRLTVSIGLKLVLTKSHVQIKSRLSFSRRCATESESDIFFTDPDQPELPLAKEPEDTPYPQPEERVIGEQESTTPPARRRTRKPKVQSHPEGTFMTADDLRELAWQNHMHRTDHPDYDEARRITLMDAYQVHSKALGTQGDRDLFDDSFVTLGLELEDDLERPLSDHELQQYAGYSWMAANEQKADFRPWHILRARLKNQTDKMSKAEYRAFSLQLTALTESFEESMAPGKEPTVLDETDDTTWTKEHNAAAQRIAQRGYSSERDGSYDEALSKEMAAKPKRARRVKEVAA